MSTCLWLPLVRPDYSRHLLRRCYEVLTRHGLGTHHYLGNHTKPNQKTTCLNQCIGGNADAVTLPVMAGCEAWRHPRSGISAMK